MSRENVEIVHAAIAAYMSGDETTFRRLAAPDVLISGRPDQPDAREHRGYEGMLEASREWLEAWDDQIFEAAQAWDAGELVFVRTRESGRGRASGVLMESESVFVFTLSAGTIVRVQVFGSEHEARQAVALGE